MSQPIWRTIARRSGQTILAVPKAVSTDSALILHRRLFHPAQPVVMASKQSSNAKGSHNTAPVPPEPSQNPTIGIAPSRDENVGQKRLADFDLAGRVFIVTGGARGLGLSLAEALVETGGKVYCLDREEHPDEEWSEAARRADRWGGSLHYCQQDVQDTKGLDKTIETIADRHRQLDGIIAAAGVQQICPAVEYSREDVTRIMDINYTGVMMTATSAARQMFKYKCHGSMCFIASMSGQVANKGLISPVYNSSKAAILQLARNLAMEWSPIRKDGTGGIRVNCISPGHILTPMVLKNFEEVPGLREKWESANMMGRLAETTEFKGAALFLLSNASSYMTGSNLIIDGGHTSCAQDRECLVTYAYAQGPFVCIFQPGDHQRLVDDHLGSPFTYALESLWAVGHPVEIKMPELSESITAVREGAKEDSFTYLTILQYHASTPGILPTLNEVLQDVDLTREIGWDLVQTLIPIEGSEECLETVARLGNPREVIIKVMETLGVLARQWEKAQDDIVEEDSGTQDELVEDSDSIPSRIITLIGMLAILQRRIKTKYPSRFLAPSLISVLEAYLPTPEMTTAAINLVRSLSGRVRPPLPTRTSSIDVLNPDEHGDFSKNAPDPEAEPEDPKEESLNRKLLQSFTTCILQRYINVHEMQWSLRLLEVYHPEKIVPGKATTTQLFREDETLQKRDAVVGQLVALLRDLGMNDFSTAFVRGVLCQPSDTEPMSNLEMFDSVDDIQLSQGGTAGLIAYWIFSTDAFGADNPIPKMHIFPDHFDMMRLFLGAPGTNPESDPGGEIQRNPGIADALLAIGLGLHHRGLVTATEHTNYMAYHHYVTLIAEFHSDILVKSAAMRFAGTLLHSDPDYESRLDILEDLLKECASPPLKACAIKWLQEEIIAAHNDKVSNVFSTPEVIERLRDYLFPDPTKMEGDDFKEIWGIQHSFFHQAANFAYFLFNGRKDLVPVGMGARVEQQFAEPLTTATDSGALIYTEASIVLFAPGRYPAWKATAEN
ncbi:hypothetical protein O1611_g3228 [Lasiodiplodia mahajangana]|uniref:Uncharacterized protein n=1 Tax=Lasiodiplodia mahajangana TaxID=1108764 RepID=A0ACC2JST2_9PEZI|nr:hypothetical protein O1611_g3228 [Lasiodiplodia mahajangana]